ncbi:MAG: aldehyde dehydrogenase family protein [Bacteroidota bacterium]
MDIINPATENLITELTPDSPAFIQQLYEDARDHQPAWAARPLEERLSIIRNFYKLMDDREDDLARILTEEMGKPLQQSYNELKGAQGRIEFFLEHAATYLADEWMVPDGGTREKITYEPLGVIANISAWNYPYLVGVNVFIPALIAGNAVMYKPSEHAALTGLRIEALLREAGVPDEIFCCVTGDRESGELLLKLPLDGYFFTGSYRTGQYIYQKVAHKMVPCQMELGGKDPLYVTADNADLKKVAQAAVEGAFYNSGQSCCAVERIYVHEDVYDDFLDHFVEETGTYKVGNPLEKETSIGPLARKDQVHFLQKQVGDALLKGASIACGEERWEGQGYYFIPTVVVDVDHSMDLMKEESFGPVIGIKLIASSSEATF